MELRRGLHRCPMTPCARGCLTGQGGGLAAVMDHFQVFVVLKSRPLVMQGSAHLYSLA